MNDTLAALDYPTPTITCDAPNKCTIRAERRVTLTCRCTHLLCPTHSVHLYAWPSGYCRVHGGRALITTNERINQ